jgi:DNA-binding transcriptional MerR regulator
MYKISEMAALTGLSRTALLYYEKLGLIRADRQANGYRIYSDMDLQRLRLIQKLQAGGLSLKEIRAVSIHKSTERFCGSGLKSLIVKFSENRNLGICLQGSSGNGH